MTQLPKRLRQAKAEYIRQQHKIQHADCEKIIKQKGPHWGLYCKEHGTWFKWVSKEEIAL